MDWFVSDLHFGHQRIIDLCGRPFVDVTSMDNALISNWNDRVQKDDTVYIIGDFACRQCSDTFWYLSQLMGNKILICGNHDPFWLEKDNKIKGAFLEICYLKHIMQNDSKCTLCHYPMIEWPSSRIDNVESYGYLIHGHIHNSPDIDYNCVFKSPFQLNASVEVNGYKPVSFLELQHNNEIFKLKVLKDDVDKAKFIARKYLYNVYFEDGTPLITLPYSMVANCADSDAVDILCFVTMMFQPEAEQPIFAYLKPSGEKAKNCINRGSSSIDAYMKKLSGNRLMRKTILQILREMSNRGYIKNEIFKNDKEVRQALTD